MNEEATEYTDFQDFVLKLTAEIDKSLNPGETRKIGFACFIFNDDGTTKQVHVTGNVPEETIVNVANTFIQKQKIIQNRKTRTHLKKVK